MRQVVLVIVLVIGGFQQLFADGITLLGVVLDRHRGEPIFPASIQILDFRGLTLGAATTDLQGRWRVVIPLMGIGNQGAMPQSFSLDQNYPNPFNPSTKIPFTIGREEPVRISVHNVLGQLIDAKEFHLRPGSYTVDWSARGGARVLFYSIEIGNVRLTGKMIQLDGGNGNGLGNVLLTSRSASLNLSAEQRLDSCRIITSSLLYESDTLTVPLVDSTHVNISLESVHDRAFVIDLHNDVVEKIVGSNYSYQLSDRHTYNHTDVPRYRDGGVDGQIFSIWIDPAKHAPTTYFSNAKRFLDTLKAQARRNPEDLGLVVQSDSIDTLNQQGKIAGVVVVEGGHCIEDKLDNLLALYAAGVRVVTITWNNSTSWAVSAQDARADSVGLNDFGKQVIRTMDSLGMIIDISHVGRRTVEDILAISRNPIIASHSGAYALRSHYRNLTDSQIRAIAQRNGVIGVVFYPTFLSASGNATIETVVQHIDYIKNLVGVDFIALGSDFDGIEKVPLGLEDVSRFPALTEALLRRGYSREDVRKILGENFMRVFRMVCK